MRLGFRSLKWKVIASVFALNSIFGLAVLLVINWFVFSNLLTEKKKTVESIAGGQVEKVATVLSEPQLVARFVAGSPQIVDMMTAKKQKIQDEEALSYITSLGSGHRLQNIYVMNTKGDVVLSVDATFLNNNFAFRDYFKSAMSDKEYSELAFGVLTKKPGIYFSSPIKKDNKVVGVAVVKADPSIITSAFEGSNYLQVGSYMLVDENGVVISSNKKIEPYQSLGKMSQEKLSQLAISRSYEGFGVKPLHYQNIMDALVKFDGKTFVTEMRDEVDNESEFIILQKVGEFPYFLVTESNTEQIFASAQKVTLTIAVFLFLAVGMSVLFQYLPLSKLFRPLKTLEQYSKDVAGGNLDQNFELRTGDEIESLANSLKMMILAIKDSYKGVEQKIREKTEALTESLAQLERKNEESGRAKQAILNLMDDVNDEKDKIAREKYKVETILTSIGDGVFVVNKEGNLILMNRMAQEMCGYKLFEALGKKYSKIMKFAYEKDLARPYPKLVESVLASGQEASLEPFTVMIKKNGEKLPVLDSISPTRDEDGKVNGCVIVIRDNTKERALQKSKDEFLSVASHQLRTPLGSMRWNAEILLAGDFGKLSKEVKEAVEQILLSNIRMIELVNDLLNVSRIDEGKVMDVPEMTDINPILVSTAKEVGLEAEKRKIKIKLVLSNQIPHLYLDPKRFREVVENLLSNAVKYNKAEGKVEIKTMSKGDKVMIQISDTGMGIAKDDLGKLFEKFFRAETAVRSDTEGTGLGLFVAKQYVEGWGGEIKVESVPGKGSIFTILLPKQIVYQKLVS